LFARRFLVKQFDLAAVLARKTQHEFAKTAIAGAFRENPADDADDVGSRLSGEDPDQIRKQEMADRDLASRVDDEPCRRRGEHGFDHHQGHHHEQRRREQIAGQIQTCNLLPFHGCPESSRGETWLRVAAQFSGIRSQI
jgi:hypothetical protein